MSTQAVLGLFTDHADGTETVPPVGLPGCRACDGTGQVVPDAFGEHQSWAGYVAQVEEYERRHGFDPATCGSAIRAGLIGPKACPECIGKGDDRCVRT